ncbi:ABC-type amino acid transport substrate-binding protein [Pseudomonas lini]|nr:ABC-type amino acid transport substrate-binding protein [Pseudomonas lini]
MTANLKEARGKMLVGVTALVAINTAQAGAIDDAVKRGTLKVGMDPTYMPFEMTNKRGEIIGFEVDILKAMTKAMASSWSWCPPATMASSRP